MVSFFAGAEDELESVVLEPFDPDPPESEPEPELELELEPERSAARLSVR